MKQNHQYYLDLISQGESEKIEFLLTLPKSEHFITIILSAFANTKGGHLFIGVSTDGNIVGLPYADTIETADRLTKICDSIFTYPFKIELLNFNNRNIVYAKIDEAPEHLKPITTGNGTSYVKNGRRVKNTNPENKKLAKDDLKPQTGEITGFIAMSFRTEEDPSLIDYYNAMIRAAQRTTLPIRLTRIDLEEGDFEISKQIMTAIQNADFILADFTLSPHNVYFEVGFARGANKRIIQTAKKDTILQFDVRNWRTLFYRNATELEEKLVPSLEAIYKKLKLKEPNDV